MKPEVYHKSVWQPCCFGTDGRTGTEVETKKQVTDVPTIASADSAKIAIDSMFTAQDSSKLASLNQPAKPVRKKRNWATLATRHQEPMVRTGIARGIRYTIAKYWKPAFIYGGFVGCTYAITWNNQMYQRLFASLHGYYGR